LQTFGFLLISGLTASALKRRDGIPLLRTLLGFSAGRKAYERRMRVEISGKRPISRRAARRSNTQQTTTRNSTDNH
jgi:hypothetical protein